jgi:PEP-CTERM motif-containing protein
MTRNHHRRRVQIALSITPWAVPAPSALTLTGLGAAIAGAFTWRRRKRAR